VRLDPTEADRRRRRERAFWAERPDVHPRDLSDDDLEELDRIRRGTDLPAVREAVQRAGRALVALVRRFERTPGATLRDFPALEATHSRWWAALRRAGYLGPEHRARAARACQRPAIIRPNPPPLDPQERLLELARAELGYLPFEESTDPLLNPRQDIPHVTEEETVEISRRIAAGEAPLDIVTDLEARDRW